MTTKQKTLWTLCVLAVVVLCVLIAGAFYWPAASDDAKLDAPETIEEFFPLQGDSQNWELIFSSGSGQYGAEFSAIEAHLRNPSAVAEEARLVKEQTEPLWAAVDALAATEPIETPYFFSETTANLRNFRTFIDFAVDLSDKGDDSLLPAAAVLSEVLFKRAKDPMDYWLGVAGLLAVHRAGGETMDADQFASTWRASLGRAVKCEYYALRGGLKVESGFLLQENKTWNELWEHYSEIDSLLQADRLGDISPAVERRADFWSRKPYSNLKGNAMIALIIDPCSIQIDLSRKFEKERREAAVPQGEGGPEPGTGGPSSR